KCLFSHFGLLTDVDVLQKLQEAISRRGQTILDYCATLDTPRSDPDLEPGSVKVLATVFKNAKERKKSVISFLLDFVLLICIANIKSTTQQYIIILRNDGVIIPVDEGLTCAMDKIFKLYWVCNLSYPPQLSSVFTFQKPETGQLGKARDWMLLAELGVRGKAHRQAVKYFSRAAEKGSQWLWVKRKDSAWAFKRIRPAPRLSQLVLEVPHPELLFLMYTLPLYLSTLLTPEEGLKSLTQTLHRLWRPATGGPLLLFHGRFLFNILCLFAIILACSWFGNFGFGCHCDSVIPDCHSSHRCHHVAPAPALSYLYHNRLHPSDPSAEQQVAPAQVLHTRKIEEQQPIQFLLPN
ncbi:hypothetical protein INR49_031878, partial [Caranx melampygus]